MSDVNLDFTVNNNSIGFTVAPNDITFTPSDIQLSFYTAPAPVPAGTTGQLQYNNAGVLAGANNTSYSNGNLTLTVANTKITGGTNHYYLQTDGTGNLTWAVGTGNISGNGTVGGANTQIQFNDGGANFGGNAGFIFNKVNGNVDIPGNLYVVGNITGTVTNAYHANYADIANSITGANVVGEVAFAAVANSVSGGNVVGQVSNALVSGTVYTNAQPNITSVGTLTSLTVSGITTIQEAIEKFTPNASAATGTINYDLLNQAIILNTANATANFTLNFRGNSSTALNSVLASNQSITCTFINTNGANAYFANNIQIDGSNITPIWSSVVSGTINAKDVYTFNILKTASSTYTVLGSVIGYY